MFHRILILSLSAALSASLAVGQTTTSSEVAKQLNQEATKFDSSARKAGNPAVFKALSERLNIPTETLQAQKQSSNFGFGQLFIANALAKASGKTFDQISNEFKSGKGWGEICKEDNLKVGQVMRDLKRTDHTLHEERKEQMRLAKENKGQSEHAKGSVNRAGSERHAGAGFSQHGARSR